MKTIITSTIIALAFISFSSFSQSQGNNLDVESMEISQSNVIDNAFNSYTLTIPQDIPNKSSGLKADPFCDDFNVPNTSTIPGWTEQSGDWQIVDNMLKTPGGNGEVITLDGSTSADGIITTRAIYDGATQVKYVGLLGRYINEGTNILFKIQDNSTSGDWNAYFVYLPGGGISGFGSFGTDAIIQLEYEGANVTIRIDSDQDGIWDHTNSTTTSLVGDGLCGIEGYGNASVDDYCIGEDNTPPSVPISNMAIVFGILFIGTFIIVRMKA